MTTRRKSARSAEKPRQSLPATLQQGLLLWVGVLGMFVLVIFLGSRSDDGRTTTIGVIGASMAGIGLMIQSYALFTLRRSYDIRELINLRAIVRRAQAVYDLSNTLSSSLSYSKALSIALGVGNLALRPSMENTNVVSAVLLFRQQDNVLHIAMARYLNRQDHEVTAAARQGILAKALESAEPVFGENGATDPELRRFASFLNAKSLLAIPLRQGYESYGVLLFGAEAPNAFDTSAADALSAIGIQVSIALKNAVLYQGILDDKERIVAVDEQARKKLSRDLHDGPTQSIALMSSISSVVQKYLKQGDIPKANAELEKVQQLSQKTVKEIRHLLFSLRPLVLENKGLIAALNELAKKMEETYSQQVMIDADNRIETLIGTEEQGTIFYIIEEAVNNALKHAEAETIWVRIAVQGMFVTLEIEDNGSGFDVQAVNTDYHKRGSLGMVNLRERSEMLKGEFNMQSEIGRGTRIKVFIPVEDNSKQAPSSTQPRLAAKDTRMAADIHAHEPPPPENDNTGWSDIKL